MVTKINLEVCGCVRFGQKKHDPNPQDKGDVITRIKTKWCNTEKQGGVNKLKHQVIFLGQTLPLRIAQESLFIYREINPSHIKYFYPYPF